MGKLVVNLLFFKYIVNLTVCLFFYEKFTLIKKLKLRKKRTLFVLHVSEAGTCTYRN